MTSAAQRRRPSSPGGSNLGRVATRPALPRPLERQVLVEAGHRCALPTCRSVPVEIAHIHPRAKGGDDTFENLIALCPTCHTRYDNGDIDRLAMGQYKANLTLLNSRYGDLERRVLDYFVQDADGGTNEISLPESLSMLLWHLVADGMLELVDQGGAAIGGDVLGIYRLTENGKELVRRSREHEQIR
jgi:HNH endonuclease